MKRTATGVDGWAGHCPHTQKRRYFSRKDARAAHLDLSAFLCPHCGGLSWHLGTLPTVVQRGMSARPTIQAPRNTA